MLSVVRPHPHPQSHTSSANKGLSPSTSHKDLEQLFAMDLLGTELRLVCKGNTSIQSCATRSNKKSAAMWLVQKLDASPHSVQLLERITENNLFFLKRREGSFLQRRNLSQLGQTACLLCQDCLNLRCDTQDRSMGCSNFVCFLFRRAKDASGHVMRCVSVQGNGHCMWCWPQTGDATDCIRVSPLHPVVNGVLRCHCLLACSPHDSSSFVQTPQQFFSVDSSRRKSLVHTAHAQPMRASRLCCQGDTT